MLKAIVGAVVMLSVVAPASAQWGAPSAPNNPRVEASAVPPASSKQVDRGEPLITLAQIARLKSALRLKSEQLVHWGPVEGALMEIARDRSAAVSDAATKLRRLKALALPLIKSLDDVQRAEAVAFANRVGYGQLASSL